MDLLLAALALGALVVGAHAARKRAMERRHRAGSTFDGGSDDRELAQLQVQDIVLDGSQSLVVQRVVRCCDGERVWREAQLEDGRQPCWMVVDEGASDRVLVGSPVAPPPIAEQPSRQVEHGGRVYELERWGRAACRSLSPALAGPEDEVDYWDYSASGRHRLWLRRSAGSYRCYAGELRLRGEFELLPHA